MVLVREAVVLISLYRKIARILGTIKNNAEDSYNVLTEAETLLSVYLQTFGMDRLIVVNEALSACSNMETGIAVLTEMSNEVRKFHEASLRKEPAKVKTDFKRLN